MLKHNIDLKDDINITHLTWQIEKVLTFSDWKNDPLKFKKFSINFNAIRYNWWEYQHARYYVLYFQINL